MKPLKFVLLDPLGRNIGNVHHAIYLCMLYAMFEFWFHVCHGTCIINLVAVLVAAQVDESGEFETIFQDVALAHPSHPSHQSSSHQDGGMPGFEGRVEVCYHAMAALCPHARVYESA